MKGDMKNKDKVMKKVEKDYPEFVDAVNSLAGNDLEKRILEYAKQQEQIDEELSNNEIIKTIKDNLKETRSPFVDAKKAVKLKMRYLMALLEERGQSVTNE
jgi:tRNA uridine 5-carbamoylmethylation protein Kti12